MSYADLLAFAEQHHCPVLLHEPLSRHTSFKIGGPADVMLLPGSPDCLCAVVRFCAWHTLPCFVMGNGSNLLVRDDGYRGVIIKLGENFSGMTLLDDGVRIEVLAGTTLNSLASFALEHSLCGLEFAYGIPGTVGGAVMMNAGAYGGDIAQVIDSATCIDTNGVVHTLSFDQLDFSYRHSVFCEHPRPILSARFRLASGDRAQIKARMDQNMQSRKTNQPLHLPSAGSTFKRPEGSYASLLVDQCGLKGVRVGGAQVSEKHAGFVVNTGGATCGDVLALIDLIKTRVKAQTGFVLECEVKML